MIKNKKIQIAFSIVLTLAIFFIIMMPTIISGDVIKTQIEKNGFNTSTILLEKNIEIEIGILIISIITITFSIITFLLFLKPKVKQAYLRNTKDVIEPVLAETVIDGKIDLGNLIMTVLADQIYRKRIILDNNKLLLKNRFDMKEYEREILDLIFYGSGDSVDINNLDRKYISEGKDKIVATYKKIKQLIIEELLKRELYKKESILKKISEIGLKIYILVIMFFISLPRLPWAEAYKKILFYIDGACMGTIIIQILVILLCFLCNIGKKGKKLISGLGIPLIPLSIWEIFSIIFNILNGGWGYSLNLSIIILNIIGCIYFIRKLRNEKITLTNKGKEEYKKVKSLKNYIIDYSLIKDRDIDSVFLWDEYLIYAIAFGIPNKITEKFSVRLLDINIDLEKVDKTMNFIF